MNGKFKLSLAILCLMLTLLACISQGTMDKVKEAGKEFAQGVMDKGKEELEKAKKEAYDQGFKAGQAALRSTVENDKDISQESKDELLKQITGATSLTTLAGILLAFAKAKAAAKAKQALGIAVAASQKLPGEALAMLKQEMKSMGGDHPAIASLIAEVKQ